MIACQREKSGNHVGVPAVARRGLCGTTRSPDAPIVRTFAAQEGVYVLGYANQAMTIGTTSFVAGDSYLARVASTGGVVDIAVRVTDQPAALVSTGLGKFSFAAGSKVYACVDGATAISCTQQADIGSGAVIGLLATATNGSIMLAGNFSGAHAFGPINLTAPATGDIFIANYSNGVKFATQLGVQGTALISSLVTTPTSSLYVAGRFSGAIGVGAETTTSKGMEDVFLGRFDFTDTTVTQAWIDGFGAAGSSAYGRVLGIGQAGGPLLEADISGQEPFVGVDFGGGALARGIALASFQPDGTHVWSRGVSIYGNAALGPGGAIMVAGSYLQNSDDYAGKAAFGGADLPVKGGEDSVFAVLSPP